LNESLTRVKKENFSLGFLDTFGRSHRVLHLLKQ
jgi:hypothetical protein